MPLPILPSTTDLRTVTERVNPLIKDYNREDKRVPLYALETGSATAYAIAPIPGIEMYVVGQIFGFKAANANTGTAPTLAVNGLTAGTITYPDGSALVPGDIAANGFYMVQVASTTPTFHLMTGPKRRLLQVASTLLSTVATGTTTLPCDNTIPQQSGPAEGTEFMTLAITPKSAASTLIIEVEALFSNSTTAYCGMALFQDSTAGALKATAFSGNAADAQPVRLRHVMTSGTTSATTFRMRAGPNAAATLTFNGAAATQFFGGVAASSIVITEVLP